MSFVEHYRDFPGGGPKGLNRIAANMDELNSLQSTYGALIYRSASQSIAANTSADILFNATTFDDGGFVGSGASANGLVCPSGFSFVRLTANVRLSTAFNDASGDIFLNMFISRNGAYPTNVSQFFRLYNGGTLTNSSITLFNFKTDYFSANVGDYFRLNLSTSQALTITAASGGAAWTWFGIEGKKTP